MATTLVNPKMNPALAARVRASVTGRRHAASHSTARRMSWLRFGAVAVLVWLSVSILLSVRRERAALENARQALLARWSAESGSLRPEDGTFLARAEKSLATLRGPYSGDFVATELRSSEDLLKLLMHPAVYFRAPDTALTDSPTAVAKAASESGKDTLLLCLMAPPTGRDEKSLLTKARLAMAGGTEFLQSTQTALRLHDVETGLPLLLHPWSDRIRQAKTESGLQQLERELKRAPLGATKRALRSQLLIGVLDEPNEPGTVTELDGEAPHGIRLAIIELNSERPLLRIRKRVDPSWITPNRRPQYARELDGCRFALDVRQAVQRSGSP